MKGSATITFSQAGVEPPVYVVTSLSNPPWATLELTPGEKTPSGDIVFKRQFENTPEGSYQYKVRIGEGHWVVDESKESATDEQGNRNNVVHVEHASETNTSASRLAEKDSSSKEPVRNRNDSTMDVRLPVAPVPFVMVEKVTDKEQPEYGDVEPEHLPTDASKRAADAEPDFERVRKDAVSPDHNLLRIDTDEDAAPLFRHESFQASESSQSLPDGVEAESLQSSTGMSSGDAMDTPSETAGSQDDELNLAPLLSHETGFSAGVREPEGPLLSHEHDEADEHDELSLAPLLSHESGFSPKNEDERSEDEDELHLAPLLSHESDFSQQKHSEGNFARDEDDWGPQHYQHGRQSKSFEARPALQHRDSLLDEEHLLPHERTSTGSFSGSERSYEHNSIPDTNQPMHGYETEYAREIFGGGRPTFFRTNSSTLPHRLPKTDEEDHDLRDASLEQFPVGRDQILARVATIGNKLPEDETIASPHSPQGSTFSQACSSVDLVPVKSYISLASVREDEEEEEEEEEGGDDDNDSVSSPIFMSSSSAAFARDPLATPHSNDSKQLGPIPEDKSEINSEKPDMRTIEISESGSVNRTDGAMDSSKDPSKASDLVGAHATPSQTLTPPLTPEPKTLPVESELRQRREPAKDQTDIYTTASSRQLENQNHTFLGYIIRFLTSCIGTRKRASVAALVVVAAYCWVTLRQ